MKSEKLKTPSEKQLGLDYRFLADAKAQREFEVAREFSAYMFQPLTKRLEILLFERTRENPEP